MPDFGAVRDRWPGALSPHLAARVAPGVPTPPPPPPKRPPPSSGLPHPPCGNPHSGTAKQGGVWSIPHGARPCYNAGRPRAANQSKQRHSMVGQIQIAQETGQTNPRPETLRLQSAGIRFAIGLSQTSVVVFYGRFIASISLGF